MAVTVAVRVAVPTAVARTMPVPTVSRRRTAVPTARVRTSAGVRATPAAAGTGVRTVVMTRTPVLAADSTLPLPSLSLPVALARPAHAGSGSPAGRSENRVYGPWADGPVGASGARPSRAGQVVLCRRRLAGAVSMPEPVFGAGAVSLNVPMAQAGVGCGASATAAAASGAGATGWFGLRVGGRLRRGHRLIIARTTKALWSPRQDSR
ncbi:hypothetical protein SHIRM173S_00654 [Streptomyces hirsutus]